MSFEAEWPISHPPTIEELETHLAEISARAAMSPPKVTRDSHGNVEILFAILVANAEYIPARLGFSDHAAEQVSRDLDPPRGAIDMEAADAAGFVEHGELNGMPCHTLLPGHERFEHVPDHYRVRVTIFAADDDSPPRVNVYSNSDDNRAAWPVVHDLGLALAQRLGIVDDESPEPSPDALN